MSDARRPQCPGAPVRAGAETDIDGILRGPVFDFHTHIFPDALAARAVEGLAASSRLVPVTAADRAAMKAYLRAQGVTRAVCNNIAVSPRTERKVNDFALSLREDDFFVPFGSVHPQGNWREELSRLAEAGVRGVKFHPEYQGFDVDDEGVFALYEACAERGLVMTFHCGQDLAYETPRRASPAKMARAARAFPGTKMVAAHLGGFADWQEVLDELSGLGLYADLAAVGMEYEQPAAPRAVTKERVNALVRCFGADRVLFATDAPWQSPWAGYAVLALLDLTEGERAGIMHANAEKLLAL